MTLLSKVKCTIRKRGLLDGVRHVLVAVSGGADSVALLLALRSMTERAGLELTVAHLDHGIRKGASCDDARFVRRLTEELGVPLIEKKSNVPGIARRRRVSLEMAAREARYAFFRSAAKEAGADVVATGHTADDQAETIVLRLARGTGLTGLCGLRYRSVVDGTCVIHPLLDVTRSEVVAYLGSRRQDWREDESNASSSFLRNRVRREVLPCMEAALNPRVREVLLRTSEILREEDTWLSGLAEAALGSAWASEEKGALSVDALGALSAAVRRRVLVAWLALGGLPYESVGFDAVDRLDSLVCRCRTGASICLPGGWRVRRRHDYVELVSEPVGPPARFRAAVRIPGETILPVQRLRIVTRVAEGIIRDRSSCAGLLPAAASISLQAAGSRKLFVRSWNEGDRMKPFGLCGSKKVQDIFVDDKVPRDKRCDVPLFECAKQVVWIPGYRIARGWELADDRCKALHIRVEQI